MQSVLNSCEFVTLIYIVCIALSQERQITESLKNVVKEDQELSLFTKTAHMNYHFKVVFKKSTQ